MAVNEAFANKNYFVYFEPNKNKKNIRLPMTSKHMIVNCCFVILNELLID